MSSSLFQKHWLFYCAIAILLIAFFLIRDVNAANQAELKVSTEPEGIIYKITEKKSLDIITFHLMEDSGEHSAPVIFFTDGLKGESATRSIEAKSVNISLGYDYASVEFLLNRSDLVEITVTVDTQNVEPDVYKGKLTLHSNNASNIEIPVKIEVSEPLWVPAGLSFFGVFIGLLFTVAGIALPKIRDAKDYKAKKEILKKTFSWDTFWKQAKAVIAFIGILVILWLVAFNAYFPNIAAFGANPLIDYGSAFLFGIAQVGASKITADVFKS